jgi:hypothetical protein
MGLKTSPIGSIRTKANRAILHNLSWPWHLDCPIGNKSQDKLRFQICKHQDGYQPDASQDELKSCPEHLSVGVQIGLFSNIKFDFPRSSCLLLVQGLVCCCPCSLHHPLMVQGLMSGWCYARSSRVDIYVGYLSELHLGIISMMLYQL